MLTSYHLFIKWLFLSLIFLSVSCQLGQQGSATYEHSLCDFKLLSKKDAAKAVIVDTKEGYFEKVTALEITLLLHLDKAASTKEEVMDTYLKKLQDDTQNFTAEEQKALSTLFAKALDMCQAISPNLKLPEINLIKTAGGYYGASVFYTRDNCIVIPGIQLKSEATLLRTLIHEIFHIYSRYNTAKRDSLYAAIGYNKIKKLDLSPFLKKRILYNPDGVDVNYAIEVQDTAGRSIQAVPIIYSKFSSYQMVPFHRHFVFQLFEVVEEGGAWEIVSEEVGLGEREVAGYWEKIGRNTKYTIHPDEVLADNFAIIAFAKVNPEKELGRLNPAGKALLGKLEGIIKE